MTLNIYNTYLLCVYITHKWKSVYLSNVNFNNFLQTLLEFWRRLLQSIFYHKIIIKKLLGSFSFAFSQGMSRPLFLRRYEKKSYSWLTIFVCMYGTNFRSNIRFIYIAILFIEPEAAKCGRKNVCDVKILTKASSTP